MIKNSKDGYYWETEVGSKEEIIGINASNDINGNKTYKVFLKGGTHNYTKDCTLPYYFYKKWYSNLSSLYRSKNYGLPENEKFKFFKP